MNDSSVNLEQKRELLRKIMQERNLSGENGDSPGFGSQVSDKNIRHLEDLPEINDWSAQMKALIGQGLKDPCFRVLESPAEGTVTIAGRVLLDFSGYNYLGLAADPRVQKAAKDAIDSYGTSASASRLASGERPLHLELEARLADFLGVEDALVFTAGYATNVSVLGHLLTSEDLVLHDDLAHNSIIVGCQLSRAKRLSFPHNDLGALDGLLARNRKNARMAIIAVEGAYSMDGDYPDLPQLIKVARKHSASLYVDEAHSLGVMGASGRGIGEHFNIDRSEVDLWMGTLSKSLSSVGGYVAGSRKLIRYLKYTVPGFIFSAGLPPASAASALASLKLLEQEPWRVEKLRENSQMFLTCAQNAGLDTGLSRETAVVPIIIHNSVKCLKVAAQLFDEGINVFPMVYPAVPETEARLRFFISAAHTPEQIQAAISTLARCLNRA